MSAMTWWDHSTKSIWSQPWERAIDGPLKGTELDLLSSQVTTWANWREEHVETLVMINDVERYRRGPEEFYEDFVIGLVLEDTAKAYAYPDVADVGAINDMMGEYPVLVWANADNYHRIGYIAHPFAFEGCAMSMNYPAASGRGIDLYNNFSCCTCSCL